MFFRLIVPVLDSSRREWWKDSDNTSFLATDSFDLILCQMQNRPFQS